jgi:hypothetical protein
MWISPRRPAAPAALILACTPFFPSGGRTQRRHASILLCQLGSGQWTLPCRCPSIHDHHRPCGHEPSSATPPPSTPHRSPARNTATPAGEMEDGKKHPASTKISDVPRAPAARAPCKSWSRSWCPRCDRPRPAQAHQGTPSINSISPLVGRRKHARGGSAASASPDADSTSPPIRSRLRSVHAHARRRNHHLASCIHQPPYFFRSLIKDARKPRILLRSHGVEKSGKMIWGGRAEEGDKE